MTNDHSFKTILDSFPPKLSRSGLEPYAELILELHRRGRSYREIARILSERCDIRTSRSTVNDFVRARLKRARSLQKGGLPEPNANPHKSAPSCQQTSSPPESGAVNDEIRYRIAALKHRRTQSEAETVHFEYDPSQPLHLPPNHLRNKK